MSESSPEGQPFSFGTTDDDRVLIWWQGRLVVTVAGREGRRLAARLQAGDATQRQALLARATGNFRRGNERDQR